MRHSLTVPDTPQEPEPLGSGEGKDRTRRVTRVSDQHRWTWLGDFDALAGRAARAAPAPDECRVPDRL